VSYHVFVLRLWRDQAVAGPESASWRLSLEDPHTRHRRGFDGVDALASFLAGVTSAPVRGAATIPDPPEITGGES